MKDYNVVASAAASVLQPGRDRDLEIDFSARGKMAVELEHVLRACEAKSGRGWVCVYRGSDEEDECGEDGCVEEALAMERMSGCV